jgi:polysaccharide biosynthesis protein PslG
MMQADPGRGELSSQPRRVLALIWIGIVVLVAACIILAMWWNVNNTQNGSLAAPARLAATATPAPTFPAPIDPASAAALPQNGAAPPLHTARRALDDSFGYGILVQAPDNAAQALDQVQQLGLGWIKQPVRWADVETGPGEYNWAALDVVLGEAAARDLKVLVSVSAAPPWTRSVTAEDLDGPPDDPQTYVNFVALLLRRYPGAIHAVEVWNEMNLSTEWYVAGGLSSAAYMQLLAPTAQAIHGIDPGIAVVSGGLNPTGIDDGVMAIDDFRYLGTMIDAGLLDSVDCVGVHHKGYNLPPHVPYDALFDIPSARFRQPLESPHHSWSFYSTLRGYHDMIATAGHDTPLCVTEFGWASVGDILGPPAPDFAFDNSPEEQAEYIVQAFEMMREWDFVVLAILSNLDYAAETDPRANGSLAAYYRIVTPDGQPRPAFEALQAMPKQP